MTARLQFLTALAAWSRGESLETRHTQHAADQFTTDRAAGSLLVADEATAMLGADELGMGARGAEGDGASEARGVAILPSDVLGSIEHTRARGRPLHRSVRRALGALTALPLLAGAQSADSVRYGITKSRDTVTVGEPFEIRVRVRAPVDATIEFPENPDSTGTVQPRDPRVLFTTDSVQALDRTAVYRVSAWDIDTQPVRLGDVTVTWAGGTRRIPLGGIEVYVRSVLPADSALHVPKPARDLWEPRAFPWWILAALLAALAIAALLWWWWRRRHRPRAVEIVDPYVRAQREFNRLEAMGLVDAGERTRYAALVVEVLRDYLHARYPDASLSLTSRELVAMIRRHPTVQWELLSRVLHEADLAKFAGFALSEERARSLARDARGLVDHDHRASALPEREAA